MQRRRVLICFSAGVGLAGLAFGDVGSIVEEWRWSSSPTLPAYDQVEMTPIVVNLTDDNDDGTIDELDVPDVVFSNMAGTQGTSDGILRAVNGNDGTEIFTTALAPDRDVIPVAPIAAGDIDGDGLPEIVAIADLLETHDFNTAQCLVFEHDGTFKYASDLIPDRLGWPGISIADLNADDAPEIVVGRHVLDGASGALLASGTSRNGGPNLQSISTVADVDRDGKPDVVAGFTVYDVTLDGTNAIAGLTVKWEATDGAGVVVDGEGFPGVANFDGDDRAEVIVVSNGAVWLFDDDGSHLWGPVAIPTDGPGFGTGHGGPPTIADFDGDGAVEVGTSGLFRYVVFDTDGTVLWNVPHFEPSETAAAAFDFDGDGIVELVHRDEDELRIYAGPDGTVLASVASSSGTSLDSVIVADVDNDDSAEIIISADEAHGGPDHGIRVFGEVTSAWVDTRGVWNEHAYAITNVRGDGAIPSPAVPNWIDFNSFRAQSAILPETGCVGVAVAEVLCAVDPVAGPTGDYDVTLTVTNDSGIPARYILLPDSVTAPDFITLAEALPGDGSSTTIRITLTGVTPLTEACFMMVLADENVDECCAGAEVCVTVPECDCLQTTNAQLDCDPETGAFTLEFDLTNLTADDVEHVYVLPPLAPGPGSDVVIPDSYTDVPTILPYQTAHIGPITLENAIAGTNLDLRVTTHVESFAECCSEVVTFTLPSCSGGEVPCECDLDDDEQVGFSDLTQLLSAWGAPSTVEPGCDGANGFSDLTNLLSKWGRCPDASSP